MFVAPDIIQVPIPLPFPLKFVNCYLLRRATPRGYDWVLIDTGINWPPAQEAWRIALQQHGLQFNDISAIYVTHYHPDHVGLAGWWQRASGAPVIMTPYEAQTVQNVWRDGPATGRGIAALFRQHGLPSQLADDVAARAAATQQLTQPLPEISVLEDVVSTPTLSIVGRCFVPLVLPGHADEQLVLYEPATRTLLAADHVLPRISPNISCLPNTRPDPLGRYLASFDRLAVLDVASVLPGHGAAFNDLHGRLHELRAHHYERLDHMATLLQAAGRVGRTSYDVCADVFPVAQLTPHQIQFAMGETVAHLDSLSSQGRATKTRGQTIRYIAC